MAKRWAEEREARGFGDVDGSLCVAHITDDVLVASLTDVTIERKCNFCGRSEPAASDPFAVPVQELLPPVMEAVRYFYTDALETLPWDSEDQVYVGTVCTVDDVVQDVCSGAFTDEVVDDVLEQIAQTIGYDKDWTEIGAVGSGENLEYGWSEYVDLVQTTSLFVFVSPNHSPLDLDVPPPVRLASFLENLLVYVDGPLRLVTTAKAGTSFFRGRLIETPREFRPSAAELGPAPSRLATANRMSPAGVSLFYASENAETAIAEIAGHGVKPHALVGEFHSTRDLTILDLTLHPSGGTVFSDEGRRNATMRQFLRTFVRSITTPVIPDGRQHIEYVPTQVLTEYLRWMPDTTLDGIALPSAQTGAKTFVMFFGPESCADWPTAPVSMSPASALLDLGDEAGPTFTLAQEDIAIYRVNRKYMGEPLKDSFGLWIGVPSKTENS